MAGALRQYLRRGNDDLVVSQIKFLQVRIKRKIIDIFSAYHDCTTRQFTVIALIPIFFKLSA